eukprot:TRINITY_DN42330_c0_g1_i1.p1 TRINITY_DN42330_c0_g1~~TRINITY_DN42330_c0_g1_i1.p1  ORF type:complete len:233 (+),score=42.24 TRINITY_DN42330_c0_g1_i1:111-809(+)
MALSKLSKELTRALDERGTSVDTGFDTPAETPCHSQNQTADCADEKTPGFGDLWKEVTKLKMQCDAPMSLHYSMLPSKSDVASPETLSSTPFPTPRLLPEPQRDSKPSHPKNEDLMESIPGDVFPAESSDSANIRSGRFLFGGSCLRPYTGCLGSKSVEQRVHESRRLRELSMLTTFESKKDLSPHQSAASSLMRNAASAACGNFRERLQMPPIFADASGDLGDGVAIAPPL